MPRYCPAVGGDERKPYRKQLRRRCLSKQLQRGDPPRRGSLLSRHSESPFSAMTIRFLARRFPSSDAVGWGRQEAAKPGRCENNKGACLRPVCSDPALACRGTYTPCRSPERHEHGGASGVVSHKYAREKRRHSSGGDEGADLCLQFDVLTFDKDLETENSRQLKMIQTLNLIHYMLWF